MNRKSALYAELDCPRCTRSYGVSPCTASEPEKCMNTAATCDDPENYEAEIQTIRFVESALYNDKSIPALPFIAGAPRIRPQVINSGESIGTRENGTINFTNQAHNWIDLDPYWDERSFNALEQGDFWGRFAAIYPNLQGYEFRLLYGFDGDALEDFALRHYVIEKAGPDGSGESYSMTFQDALKVIDGNKALYPFPSQGRLAADIGTGLTPFTLEPTGIGSALNPDGSAMYPASGFGSIGDEYFSYTRSGDVITPVARGLNGSELGGHDAGDSFQWAAVFSAVRPDQALDTILSSTTLPAAYIQPTLWRDNIGPFNTRLYNAIIAKPTAVSLLINDLVKDVGLTFFTDIANKRIWVEQIRPKQNLGSLTGDLLDKLSGKFLYEKRISAFLVFFAKLNPLEKDDEEQNYRARRFTIGDQPNEVLQGNTPNIRKHFSRWLSTGAGDAADFVADLMLGRYGSAPRELSASVPTEYLPVLGQTYDTSVRLFRDKTGQELTWPGQVISIDMQAGKSSIVIEEYRANLQTPGSEVIVTLDFDQLNMGGFATLREFYDDNYSPPLPGSTIIFRALDGVVYGSGGSLSFAVIMGDWPEVAADDVVLQIENLFIAGTGGDGGTTGEINGRNGGPAFYTRVAVELIDCDVGGGGGGGGYGGAVGAIGGAGAGRIKGSYGGFATLTTGASGLFGSGGRRGARGGDIGQAGSNSAASGGGNGGSPGTAIDGISYVTLTNTTVYGPTVN